jgi:spermidine synthase
MNEKEGRRISLVHGTTVHGSEWEDPPRRREPLAYYHRAGPVGQVLALFPPAHAVGVIGLGSGALACYEQLGQDWTFYEIDAAVERIARNGKYFHYLEECGADVKVVLGDGRLSINNGADRTYDILIIDAFSSDAIPVHLLTVEALRIYLRKIAEHGIVVFNISNGHLRLWPVVAALVKEVGGSAKRRRYEPSTQEQEAGASPSEWAVVANSDQDLAPLDADRRWTLLDAQPTAHPWTDNFSDVLAAIKFR